MHRRTFLWSGLSAALGAAAWGGRQAAGEREHEEFWPSPTHSIVPVVGDGNWVWTDPPAGQTGYLEPRPYRLSIGIQLEGTGGATGVEATTPVPVELPEQTIDSVRLEMNGCEAALRPLTEETGQLALAAGGIADGQVITAAAHFTLTLYKDYQGYQKEQFPAKQEFPKEFKKRYLYDSPGIQTRQAAVRDLARHIADPTSHPWDQALAYKEWVWENITPRIGKYTSVIAALRDKVGDCEERASVFVALCRALGIPARLVWVPNHNWAEFCLLDEQGQPHWVPAHTSCYAWFGWTGAHELVLQKGDAIHVPYERKPLRLVSDWLRWKGARPKPRFLAELTPLPPSDGADPGPGARRKDEKGEWVLSGGHPLDRYLRDGERIKAP